MLKVRVMLVAAFALVLASWAQAEIIFQEDFEDDNFPARGFDDIKDKNQAGEVLLSIAGPPEVQPKTGKQCLKISYPLGSTGGWLHTKFKGVPEFYCRYYRFFPEGWEWPEGYGPHDTTTFAGTYQSPTQTDLTIYLDFWKSAETFVRVATARQKWGYEGYADVLRKHDGVKNSVVFNVAKPDLVQLGKWHCVEYSATLSDPGKANGRLRLWVNGKLCSDLGGLPLLDENHGGILFDEWLLGPYFHDGTKKDQWNYMDSLVIATQHVGILEEGGGNQPPRARFTYSRDWGSMTANFDASRSADPDGTIASYSWDFREIKSSDLGVGQSGFDFGPGITSWHVPDHETATGKVVAHTYSQPGTYTVVLTVTDDKGERNTAKLPIYVGRSIGSGDGLKAEYFDGQELAGDPIAVVVAKQIAFQRQGWDGRFLWGGVGDNNGDNYSCRWTGFLQPVSSQEYTLTYEVNDGGRVWFDGKLVIDAWDKPQTASASLGKLEEGKKYPIRIEHHKGTFNEATGDWKAKLYWETPTITRKLIYPTSFYLPEGFVEP